MAEWYRILVQNYTGSWKKLVVFFALHNHGDMPIGILLHVKCTCTQAPTPYTMHSQVANLSKVLCHPLELVHCLLQPLHEDPYPYPCMATS